MNSLSLIFAKVQKPLQEIATIIADIISYSQHTSSLFSGGIGVFSRPLPENFPAAGNPGAAGDMINDRRSNMEKIFLWDFHVLLVYLTNNYLF